MRKHISILLSAVLLLSLTACGQQPEQEEETTPPVQEESQDQEEQQSESTAGEGKVLVVYFSASGNTETAAQGIATALNADLFELVPEQPYTEEDLDWTADGSRVNNEHDDESLRDIPLTNAVPENWDSYDTVFIGYPIWWGIAAWPTNTFVEANDFTGKTVIPFCTSASSGMGNSATLLADLAGAGTWLELEGQRFSSGVTAEEAGQWASTVLQ